MTKVRAIPSQSFERAFGVFLIKLDEGRCRDYLEREYSDIASGEAPRPVLRG